MKKRQKKQSINYLLLLCLVLVLSGCQLNSGKSELRVSTKPTLQFRITWDELSGRGDVLAKVVDKFNGTSQRAFVELVGGNEDFTEYEAALSSNEIDVYVIPYRYVKHPFIYTSLEPLDRVFETEWDSYYDTIVELVETDNGRVAIPWIGHSMSLIFNQDLVRRADINPFLWQSPYDLLEGVKAIKETTGYSGIGLVGANHHDLSWMVNQFVYTFGGQLTTKSDDGLSDQIAINSKETQEALEYYINELGKYAQEGWEEHTGMDVLDAFAQGEIAFEIQGPWAVSEIWKKGHPFEIGVVPLDQMGIYSEVGPLMLAIDKDTDNMAGAVEFISYLNSDEAQAIIMNGEYDAKYDSYYPFRVPVKKTVVEAEFFEKYHEFKAFVEGFKLPSISTPNETWALTEERYIYYIHQAILGNMTIEEALEEVEK